MSDTPSPLPDQPHLDLLRRLFDYHAWANAEVVDRLSEAARDRGVELMAHVVGADRLWLDRLRQRPQRGSVWPDMTREECHAAVKETTREWKALLAELDAPSLAAPCPYVNTKGEPWSSVVGDVLLHVLLHGAYHRGQVASAVRAAGGTPAYTDYIHAVRQDFVATAFEAD